MSAPIKFAIKESMSEIKTFLKKSSSFFTPRLKMLLECKKNEPDGVSKRILAETIGVNHNSIQTWRAIYINGGITALLSHNKTGFKPSVFTQQDHEAIKEKLHDAETPVIGFVELQRWIKENLDKDILYTTVVSYTKRHFNAKVKVARKSHINKDKEAVDAFKKTSVKSVSKSLKKKKKGTIR